MSTAWIITIKLRPLEREREFAMDSWLARPLLTQQKISPSIDGWLCGVQFYRCPTSPTVTFKSQRNLVGVCSLKTSRLHGLLQREYSTTYSSKHHRSCYLLNTCHKLHRPTVILQRPTVILQRPTTILQRPTIILQRPTIILQRPTIILQRPTITLHRHKNQQGKLTHSNHILHASKKHRPRLLLVRLISVISTYWQQMTANGALQYFRTTFPSGLEGTLRNFSLMILQVRESQNSLPRGGIFAMYCLPNLWHNVIRKVFQRRQGTTDFDCGLMSRFPILRLLIS